MVPSLDDGADTDHILSDGDHMPNTMGIRGDVKDQDQKLTLVQKLMLSASLWGAEASCDFEHLYNVPLLQTLGMPMSFASMTGLISGPTSALILPFIGWLTDRGSNPRRRKDMAIVFMTCLMMIAMMFVITANVLHLRYLLDYNAGNESAAAANVSFTYKGSLPAAELLYNNSQLSNGSKFQLDNWVDKPWIISQDLEYDMAGTTTSEENAGIRSLEDKISGIPFRAALGMTGFILLDLGFDACHTCLRNFVIARSPRSEHTSLLIIGLIMGSAGGVSTAVLALVDFAALFGLSYIEGGNISIRSGVQGLVIIVFVATGLLISLYTGHKLTKLKDRDLETSDMSKDDLAIHHNPDKHITRSFATNTFEESIRSLGSGREHFQPTQVFFNEYRHNSSEREDILSEKTPLLAVDDDSREQNTRNEEHVSSDATSVPMSYGANEHSHSLPNQLVTNVTPLPDLQEAEAEKSSRKARLCCRQSFTVKIFLITTAVFFSHGMLLMFTLLSADYIGKAIYKGSPDAAPGTDSLERYQQGARIASWGFLIYYATYLFFSMVHSRIYAILGWKLEFSLIHLAMAASDICLALTERLEVFYLLTVTAGLQRTCLFSVPLALINDIAQFEASKSKDGKNRAGFALSVAAAAMPASFCVLFAWIGFAEEVSGILSIPLWLAAGYGCVSIMAFSIVEKP